MLPPHEEPHAMSIWTTTTIVCDFRTDYPRSLDDTDCPTDHKYPGTEAQAIRRARRDGWTVSRHGACQHPNPHPNPEDPDYGTCMDCVQTIHYCRDTQDAGLAWRALVDAPGTTHYEARCPKHAHRRGR